MWHTKLQNLIISMFEEFMRTENEACVVRGYKLSFEKNELLVLVESIEGGVGVMARMITMRMG